MTQQAPTQSPDTKLLIFLEAQIKAIEVAKWIEGEKIKNDPGLRYVDHWIHKYADIFKQSWFRSLCRTCKIKDCRYKAAADCTDHQPDPELEKLYETADANSAK